jgi:hypothetical protein
VNYWLCQSSREFDDDYLCAACEQLSQVQTIERDDQLLAYRDRMGRHILHYLGYHQYHDAYIQYSIHDAYRDLVFKKDIQQLVPAAYWVQNALRALGEGRDVPLLTEHFAVIIDESYHVSPDVLDLPPICRTLLQDFLARPETDQVMRNYAYILMDCIKEPRVFSCQ